MPPRKVAKAPSGSKAKGPANGSAKMTTEKDQMIFIPTNVNINVSRKCQFFTNTQDIMVMQHGWMPLLSKWTIQNMKTHLWYQLMVSNAQRRNSDYSMQDIETDYASKDFLGANDKIQERLLLGQTLAYPLEANAKLMNKDFCTILAYTNNKAMARHSDLKDIRKILTEEQHKNSEVNVQGVANIKLHNLTQYHQTMSTPSTRQMINKWGYEAVFSNTTKRVQLMITGAKLAAVKRNSKKNTLKSTQVSDHNTKPASLPGLWSVVHGLWESKWFIEPEVFAPCLTLFQDYMHLFSGKQVEEMEQFVTSQTMMIKRLADLQI
ncbi:hypothetical protein B0T25DRAFT_581784 [Lasiosphaeria hispida]|uniref:Uncharacterized protein n=1 Tax=Lasiosphaeria hispida TaxID=260671 RepID=A0AAJ0MBP4_9PEZI|nr:hypothetical protein B0T25DRAFT_581784 [Lasiosphaeria hispida]